MGRALLYNAARALLFMFKKKKSAAKPKKATEPARAPSDLREAVPAPAPVPANAMVRAKNVSRRAITEDGEICKPGAYIMIRAKRLAQYSPDRLKPE